MSYAKFLAALFFGLMLVFTAAAEEVIWQNGQIVSGVAIIPDRVSAGLGPGSAEFADYLLAQILVECNPGQPRIGLPGSINKIRTFFSNDAKVDFEFLPGATLNSDTGRFEIQGLARLNVFVVDSPTDLPFFNQNPDLGVVVEAVFSQDLQNDFIEVRAMNLLGLPTPIRIEENVSYYIGLTPFFLNFSQIPFTGLHFTNDSGIGNENQSAVRQTAPDFEDWMFAGDAFAQGQPQFATIIINGDPSLILGDINQDGAVNLLDVQSFVAALGSGVFQKEADINGDGSVNLLDVELFVSLLSN